MNNVSDEVKYLLSPNAIRERTKKIYKAALEGKTHFKINEDKLALVTPYVINVIKENYPDLNIPFHSRWGHFKPGGIDRAAQFREQLTDDKIEIARKMLDLVITSVLLDAGAGPLWKYNENGTKINRSEGLGVASFHMFMSGAFSSDGSQIANGQGLQKITPTDIKQHFQVSDDNPLVGVEGRANLLKSLGDCVISKPEVFKDARPGNIIDHMISNYGEKFKASDLLYNVLLHFGDIWPARIKKDGISLGDVWSHSLLGEKETFESLVPIHKLSQWLTYSLIEPIMDAGINVTDVDGLTGLAEYRNGGLFVDLGALELRDPSLYEKAHLPSSELIIEWRALTLQLLDQIGEQVQNELGFTSNEFPLAKVLEGGTWWAGRKIAASKRSDNSPPIKIESDGTVF